MESRWGDLVIFDYELNFPDAAPLELELYSLGLMRAPEVLLGDTVPLGIPRRPGILDVEAGRHDAWLADVAEASGSLAWARVLRTRFEAILAGLRRGLDCWEQTDGPLPELDLLVGPLLDLMALHTLNWVLPLDTYTRHFADLLGDPELGRQCLLAQLTPAAPAHMVDFHAYVLTSAQAATDGADLTALAQALSEEIGYLQQQGMAEVPLERPREASSFLQRVAAGHADGGIEGELAALLTAQQRSRRRRDSLYAAALLAASTDAVRFDRTNAMAIVCRVAAEEEEQRKILQQRALRAVRQIGERVGIDASGATLAQLGAAVTRARGAQEPEGQDELAGIPAGGQRS
ncbi:hypothetical protein [Streptacidiphilus sp. EB129]|uniref:hypothetical protein n=1 Tax=Streptacidiphilus sp. EB129 TaxID=3156262 RepID=UPI003519269D